MDRKKIRKRGLICGFKWGGGGGGAEGQKREKKKMGSMKNHEEFGKMKVK